MTLTIELGDSVFQLMTWIGGACIAYFCFAAIVAYIASRD